MKKILIIQGARFGDLLQSKRLILSLLPRYEVHLALDCGLLPLAALLYPDISLHGLFFHGLPDEEKIKSNARCMAELQEHAFHTIFNCNFSRLTAAAARLFPPERVLGYRPAHISDGGMLRSPWARLVFRITAMRPISPLNLADFWAWFTPDPIAPVEVNPIAKGGGRGIGIAVAGREERRSIPLPALAQTAQTLAKMMNADEIKLFGTETEAHRSRKLQRLFTAPLLRKTRDLCGRTGWEDLIAEMTGLDCLITPDTGLMHLAAHLGVPVLACFLSSAWVHETGPYGLGHKILQTAPACAPCLESVPCPNQELCHGPWHDAAFGRLAAQAWTGRPGSQWPANMQLWESGLDSLGAVPELLAGEDKNDLRRKLVRNIVQNKLRLEPMLEEQLGERMRLLKELEMPGDFMLPPGRYC